MIKRVAHLGYYDTMAHMAKPAPLPEVGTTKGPYVVTGYTEKHGRQHVVLMCSSGHETIKHLKYYRHIPDDAKCRTCPVSKRAVAQRKYRAKPRAEVNKRTGYSVTHKTEWQCWRNIKKRCLNPSHPQFQNYGGRGITIQESWIDDFPAFLEHVGKKPSPELSLDRIDNERGYEEGNLRWATYRQQTANQRAPVRLDLMPHNWIYAHCWELIAA
jgi:hypothetical protein